MRIGRGEYSKIGSMGRGSKGWQRMRHGRGGDGMRTGREVRTMGGKGLKKEKESRNQTNKRTSKEHSTIIAADN